jgi:xanthine/uracil/vitamin C permease (AzgA family)
MLQILGPVLSKAITAMLGVFLIRLTIESGYQEWAATQGEPWEILGTMVLLWGVPVAVIEWAQRQSSSFGYLLGMAVCYFLNYIIGFTQETGLVFRQNEWQGVWPRLDELWLLSGGLSHVISACLGLWLIQTIDVGGCSAAMLSLSKGKGWLENDVGSARKIQLMAPLGNLLGFLMGPSGYSGPHCLHLSSALAFCTQAPLFPRFVGFFVGSFFMLLACLGSWVHYLPLYVATPVILWVGIAMIRQLPLSIKDEGKEVIAGLVMALSIAWTCDIALSMAFGFWIALIIRWNSKEKVCFTSWIMAISFLMYIYLVR